MEDKPSKISKKEIMVRIACVIIAFILWLYRYNIQNSEIRNVYDIKVTILNEDSIGNNLMLDPNKPSNIDIFGVKLKDPNAIVLPYHFSAEIDLKGKILKAGRNTVDYTIVDWPAYAVPFNEDDRSGKTILNLVEKRVIEKEITVMPKGQPAPGYEYLGLDYDGGFEATVMIGGPKESVDKIDKVGLTIDINDQDGNLYVSPQNITAYTADGQPYTGKDISILPEKISGWIQISKTKTVPIRISEKGNLPDNIEIDSKTTNPMVIKIAGNKELLDRTTEIITESIDLSKFSTSDTLDSSILVKLNVPEGLKIVDKGKVTNTMEVKANYILADLDTRNFRLTLEVRNLDDSLDVELAKQEISVILGGKKADLDLLVEDENISAFLDLTNLYEGVHQVPVKLNKPGNITTKSAPDIVEVVLTSK